MNYVEILQNEISKKRIKLKSVLNDPHKYDCILSEISRLQTTIRKHKRGMMVINNDICDQDFYDEIKSV